MLDGIKRAYYIYRDPKVALEQNDVQQLEVDRKIAERAKEVFAVFAILFAVGSVYYFSASALWPSIFCAAAAITCFLFFKHFKTIELGIKERTVELKSQARKAKQAAKKAEALAKLRVRKRSAEDLTRSQRVKRPTFKRNRSRSVDDIEEVVHLKKKKGKMGEQELKQLGVVVPNFIKQPVRAHSNLEKQLTLLPGLEYNKMRENQHQPTRQKKVELLKNLRERLEQKYVNESTEATAIQLHGFICLLTKAEVEETLRLLDLYPLSKPRNSLEDYLKQLCILGRAIQAIAKRKLIPAADIEVLREQHKVLAEKHVGEIEALATSKAKATNALDGSKPPTHEEKRGLASFNELLSNCAGVGIDFTDSVILEARKKATTLSLKHGTL